jgi:hypothetical protein
MGACVRNKTLISTNLFYMVNFEQGLNDFKLRNYRVSQPKFPMGRIY